MAFQLNYDTGAVEVGRYRGAPVMLHPSFFIAAILLSHPFWGMFNLRGLGLAAAFIVVLFASILIHELAHAAVAHRYRIPVVGIDVNFFGGLVHFGWRPRSMAQDAAITAAGPLSNLAIGLLAFVALYALPAPEPAANGLPYMSAFTPPNFAERLLRATAYLNFGLCAVNLLPGFPLDGGRLLYLLVSKYRNARKATLVVGALGSLFGAVTAFLFIGTLIAGMPIWAPPSFSVNWQAFQAARQGHVNWDTVAA
ncbi:MAG: M50 family metallopeptidase [Pseudomonadota bacterium]